MNFIVLKMEWQRNSPIKTVARTEMNAALETITSTSAFSSPVSRKQYNSNDVWISAIFGTRLARLGSTFRPSIATNPSANRQAS